MFFISYISSININKQRRGYKLQNESLRVQSNISERKLSINCGKVENMTF